MSWMSFSNLIYLFILFNFEVYKGVNVIRPYGSLVIRKDTMKYTRLRQVQKTMMPELDENISHKSLINVLEILRKDK
jgi:hypothetical protein